jgi:hypothetical protein
LQPGEDRVEGGLHEVDADAQFVADRVDDVDVVAGELTVPALIAERAVRALGADDEYTVVAHSVQEGLRRRTTPGQPEYADQNRDQNQSGSAHHLGLLSL